MKAQNSFIISCPKKPIVAYWIDSNQKQAQSGEIAHYN